MMEITDGTIDMVHNDPGQQRSRQMVQGLALELFPRDPNDTGTAAELQILLFDDLIFKKSSKYSDTSIKLSF